MAISTSFRICTQVRKRLGGLGFANYLDHYQGLSNDWEYGTIYCTELTKRVLLNKFPMLKNVVSLDYNKEYEIFLNKTKTIKYLVTLFDANHIAGSAMMLFKGPLGTFFHTGDSRFDDYMFDDYKVLFPNHLGKRDFIPIQDSGTNTLMKKVDDTVVCQVPESIHIDELILDNTYCDPIFRFPKREQCV